MTGLEPRVWLGAPDGQASAQGGVWLEGQGDPSLRSGWQDGRATVPGTCSEGREILRCAQDDRAVLPAALWPTRAHVRLRLMRIWADKSGLEMHYATSLLCLACG